MELLDTLPYYFNKTSETEAQFEIGENVWSSLTVACDNDSPALVNYIINNGSKPDKKTAKFYTDKAAIKFAKK